MALGHEQLQLGIGEGHVSFGQRGQCRAYRALRDAPPSRRVGNPQVNSRRQQSRPQPLAFPD